VSLDTAFGTRLRALRALRAGTVGHGELTSGVFEVAGGEVEKTLEPVEIVV
jgi:hypothetical protein